MKSFVIKICIILFVIFLVGITIPVNKKMSDNEVIFWTLQMSDFSEYMNKVISDFEAENPDIKIKWVDVPFSEGEKRTLASVLSDNPPDLINLNPDFSALLAQRGALYEIDEQYTGQFNKDIINSLKYNGKLYSLPWYATSAVTIYNKNLLSKSGAELPATFEDLGKIAPLIKEKTGAYVLLPNITENDTMLRILNKYGVTALNINSSQSIEVFDYFKNLYKSGLIPKESVTQTHREALEKYKNEALKFALFLTNYENQLELAKLTNVLAVNEKTLHDDFYTNYDKGDLMAKARVISAKQLYKIEPSFKTMKDQKEINTIVNSAVQQILLNKNTTGKILDDVSDKINLILSD